MEKALTTIHRMVILILLTVAPSLAEINRTQIEAAGISPERLGKIGEFVQRDIAANKLSGAVTLVARHGKILHLEAHGLFGVDDPRPMTHDTIFRIFSMTKPITTVAAMILYEEGAFHLSDPIEDYLPQLGKMTLLRDGEQVSPKSPMTIEQLMSHTAGLTNGWHPENPVELAYQKAELGRSADLDELISRLSTLPLRFEPGTRYHYSVATDVLGALVERLSGTTLETFFENRIFKPLGMKDTFFNVPTGKLDRVAPIHYWDSKSASIISLHENLIPPVIDVTLFSGAGGLLSTARDYWIFCEMLRQGGSFNGVRVLGPKTVQHMTMPRLTPEIRNKGAHEYPASHLYPGQSFGLGFGIITNPELSQVISSRGEYSWGGIANTKFWVDPEEDLIAILMTQVMGAPYSDALRYDMKVATYQALTDLR